MKCENCTKPALYEYKLTLEKSLFYCSNHLPAFLMQRKKAGLLTLTPKHAEEKESALATVAFKPSELNEEESKPKKKAAKKKAE